MIARLVKGKIKKDKLTDFTKLYREFLLKRSGEYSEGNKGSQLLVNKTTNEVVAFSLWETEEKMNAALGNEWNESLRAETSPYLEGSKETFVFEVTTSVNF